MAKQESRQRSFFDEELTHIPPSSNMLKSDEITSIRLMFRLMILESNGNAFEQFFTEIMDYAYTDFEQVKPWGNTGDRGCDGRIRSIGTYFQVFAPESPNKSYPEAVKKLKKDFQKLISFWPEIKHFIFVFNDKFQGVNADCLLAIDEISKQYNIRANIFRAKHLENLLASLRMDQMRMVVRRTVNPQVVLHLDIVDEIITHVRNLPYIDDDEKRVVPDWEEKIKFNDLSETIATRLNNGALLLNGTHSLNSYLDNQSDFTSQKLQSILRELYKKHKKLNNSDKLFRKILYALVPKHNNDFFSAAMVIMAKYFESCDIFKEPPQQQNT